MTRKELRQLKKGDIVLDDLSLTKYLVIDVDENGFQADDEVYRCGDTIKRFKIISINFNDVKQFTFKTEKSTGRYRSFFPDTHLIKVKRYDVGRISDTKPHGVYLNIMKKDINEDGKPNCPWRTICLKKKFESVDKAKEFLNERIRDIFNQWTLFIDYEQK